MRTIHKRKVISIGILFLGLIAGMLFTFQKSEQEYANTTTPTEEILDTSKVGHPGEGGDPGVVSIDPLSGGTAVSEVVVESEDGGSFIRSIATLKINTSELEIIVEDNTSVYDAMNLLAQQGKLRFEGKNYPGLGFFVTQIESLESGRGKNLMYDINGKEASVGISSYILKEGDIIEWKLK